MNFTKRDTNIAKFFAVILMLMHHLFYSIETIEVNCPNFKTLFLSEEMLVTISFFIGKVCVSIFIFLTGYGITQAYKSMDLTYNRPLSATEYTKDTLSRLINLEGNFLFIYIISLIVAFFTTTNNPIDVYTQGGVPIVNAIIDAFGLATGFITPTLNATWWYMSLAFIAILLMPLIMEATKKFGLLVPIFLLFVLPFCGIQYEFTSCYFPALALGAYCAYSDVFQRLTNIKIITFGKTTNRVLKCIILSVLIIVFSWLRIKAGYPGLNNTILAFLFISLSFLIFHSESNKKNISSIMAYIGELSPIIFLTHTFLTYHYCSEFLYSFQYSLLIFFTTLVCSVFLAMALNWLKKITQYNKLLLYLRNGNNKIKEQHIKEKLMS